MTFRIDQLGRTAMYRSSIVKTLKVVHRYLGLFFAPAIIFFALSGAMQTLGLHNVTQGSSYLTARWIVQMAQIHKKQTLAIPSTKRKTSENDSGGVPDNFAKKRTTDAKRALKLFVVFMSAALMITTFLGIIMASMYGGDRRIAALVLVAGILFPVFAMLL